jgi:DNA invertase Pin-like site-specific DNA recombinase
VSSLSQDFDGQVEKLKAEGCDRVYSEKVSGKSRNGRHALGKALQSLNPGDTLVVVRLDRLARSSLDLLNILDTVVKAGAGFKSLNEQWADTTTSHGRLILTILGGIAQFERELIKTRCEEGIARAKAKGTVFGRKPVLDIGQRRRISERYGSGETMGELAKDYNCAVGTIWNVLNRKEAH